MGLGNLLMGDEGVGIHVVRELEKDFSGNGIQVVDGGTGGLGLLEYFTNSDLVVIVDAACDGQPPGTVGCLEPHFSPDYPRTLAGHDLGFKDLLDAVDLLDAKPEVVLFTISIGMPQEMRLELSPEVRAAVEPACHKIRELLGPSFGRSV